MTLYVFQLIPNVSRSTSIQLLIEGMYLIWMDINSLDSVAPQIIRTTVTSRLCFLHLEELIPLVNNLQFDLRHFSRRIMFFVKQYIPSQIYLIVRELSERIRITSMDFVITKHLDRIKHMFPDHFVCIIILIIKVLHYDSDLLPFPKVKLSLGL